MKRNDKPTWLMLLRDIAEVAVSIALFGLLLWAFLWVLVNGFKEIGDALKLRTDTVSEDCGVGRATASLNGVLLFGGETDEPEGNTALRVYTEGEDSPLPEWWDPDSAELVWEDHSGEVNKMVDDDHSADSGKMVVDFAGDINVPCKSEPHAPEGIDPGGIDYNLRTTLWGWDGHCMESWEMEMFAKIAYLECRGCSRACQEAVVDAILRLWESGYYSTTLYGTLSAVNEDGTYAYSPYPTMWVEEYDPDILAEMRELCEERFYNAPEYTAPFFRTKHYHVDWSVPCYCFPEDNVYFSTFKEGVQ